MTSDSRHARHDDRSGALSEIIGYARFAAGLPGFLRRPITVDEARAGLRARLASRSVNFLALVQRVVFGTKPSPYRQMFALAGCEYGDLSEMVASRGLEPALESLAAAGVYLTFEEFKGRQLIVRQGREIPTSPKSFVNPVVARGFEGETGGSTGRARRVPIDLDDLTTSASQTLIGLGAHGLLDTPTGMWRGLLPDATGVNNVIRGARMGRMPERWFTPQLPGAHRPALKNRLATQGILSLAWLSGVNAPRPEPVALDQAVHIARWAADTVAARGSCLLRTSVSLHVRIAVAAQAAGISLAGVTMMGGDEPPTPAKIRHITAAGARWVATYVSMDVGQIGMGCGRPLDENDVHLFEDSLAAIQRPQQVPGTDMTVPAFCFTTLLPTSSRVLINAESDDYGLLERRSCGCPLEAEGLGTHLRHIRSYRKLTGEGVTLVGSEMVDILERVLPGQFGGSALDFQLREEEDASGRTRLTLVVHPSIATTDPQLFIDAVLGAMARCSVAADLARGLWSAAGTLRVTREVPSVTSRGKLMPLHLGERQKA